MYNLKRPKFKDESSSLQRNKAQARLEEVVTKGSFDPTSLVITICTNYPFRSAPPSRKEFETSTHYNTITHEMIHCLQIIGTPIGIHLLKSNYRKSLVYLNIIKLVAEYSGGKLSIPVLPSLRRIFSSVADMPDDLRRFIEIWLTADKDINLFLLPLMDYAPLRKGDDSGRIGLVWNHLNFVNGEVPVLISKYSGYEEEVWPLGASLLMEGMARAIDCLSWARVNYSNYIKVLEQEISRPESRRYYIALTYYLGTVPQNRWSLVEFIALCEMCLLYDQLSLGYKEGDRLKCHPGVLFIKGCSTLAKGDLPKITQEVDGKIVDDTFVSSLADSLSLPMPTIAYAKAIEFFSKDPMMNLPSAKNNVLFQMASSFAQYRISTLQNSLLFYNIADKRFSYELYIRTIPILRYDDAVLFWEDFGADIYKLASILHEGHVGDQFLKTGLLKCPYSKDNVCTLWPKSVIDSCDGLLWPPEEQSANCLCCQIVRELKDISKIVDFTSSINQTK